MPSDSAHDLPLTTLLGGLSLPTRIHDLPLRMLSHVGDAVFHLFEREREVILSTTAKQMHLRARVNAKRQAQLLELILPQLTTAEQELVRRARNISASGYHRGSQADYRQATAFEALLGYLYLADPERLKSVLRLTMDTPLEPKP